MSTLTQSNAWNTRMSKYSSRWPEAKHFRSSWTVIISVKIFEDQAWSIGHLHGKITLFLPLKYSFEVVMIPQYYIQNKTKKITKCYCCLCVCHVFVLTLPSTWWPKLGPTVRNCTRLCALPNPQIPKPCIIIHVLGGIKHKKTALQ